MLLPKSLTPFTFGDRVKPLVERDGQVEEGNLGRVGVSKLKTSDKALISQIGNTCLNRFRIQTVDFPGFSSKVSYIIRGYSHFFSKNQSHVSGPCASACPASFLRR